MNSLKTYIIEPTEEPSIFNLIFGTASGQTFTFELMGHVSVLPRIQNFDFYLNLN